MYNHSQVAKGGIIDECIFDITLTRRNKETREILVGEKHGGSVIDPFMKEGLLKYSVFIDDPDICINEVTIYTYKEKYLDSI